LTNFLQDFGYKTTVAYNMSIFNDIGWIFGGLACGYGSDLMGFRAPFVGFFIFLAIIPTALIYPFVDNIWVTGVLVTMNGFFAGGSGNVVASACCADLGSSENIEKFLATRSGQHQVDRKVTQNLIGQVSGIVDGIGAFGAAVSVLILNYISHGYAEAVFYTLAGMLLVALALISDLVYKETRAWITARKHAKKNSKQTQHEESIEQIVKVAAE
jgi:OPA family glycerol-3-phosphate transporter-like MFS transporter 3